MARKQDRPIAPRVSAPDLPARLDDGEPRSRADLHRQRLDGLTGDVDLEHTSLEECAVPSPVVETLALRGATLVDVEVTDIRAVSVRGRDTTIRRVAITGGRIGTLDLADARIAELELRDVRIDYLSLAGARAEDVRVVDCAIRALDLPQAQLTRVAFERSRTDELDPRGMRAADLDLRGLDVAACLDVLALRGATLTEDQVRALAPAFASAVGIDVRG
ncbi:pentapeptide repeat-containing protein [Microbacterium sp. NPDC055683]